jgi:DNA-binding IclR family transcriptional regulator
MGQKNTIATQVLHELEGAYFSLSNQNLAIRLGLNEPSVRRTTRLLVEARQIH